MSILEAIVLGIVQGLTEFLPISSSGHLVVTPALLGWDKPSLAFDLVLHLGTLAAVVISFRHELIGIARGIAGRSENPGQERRLLLYLLVATIPAAITGLGFESFFERLFTEPEWVCFFWLVTAALLVGVEALARGTATTSKKPVDLGVATTMGIGQAIALTPGISRSGATIAAGLFARISREEATRFSFLMSIPAILGASVVQLSDVATGEDSLAIVPALFGFAAAAIAGWLAIEGLLRFVRRHSLAWFALYLVIAAPIAYLVLQLQD